MSFTFSTVIYLHDAETTVEVEASYYQADPDVGYMTPWIEIDSVRDSDGDSIWRIDEEQTAALISRAWDECECMNEDRQLTKAGLE